MTFSMQRLLAATVLATTGAAGQAFAFSDCPADHVSDGYTCEMQTGAGKNGGFFRVTFPSDWDGDLVIINHGFDLVDKHIRPHETCSHNSSVACEQDSDCGSGNFCNNISYLGLDEILLPMGKAVAAGTYSASGWAVFESAKDLKDILKYVDKDSGKGDQVQRVIVTGFSLGGAVTADATLKLAIDGAVPLCGAVGGGLPTWDVAQEVRLVYDFLCDNVPGAKFGPPSSGGPDFGVKNTGDPSADSQSMALKVDTCLGNLGIMPDDGFQDQRRADFMELTQFAGGDGFNIATAMGFATLGMGDFVYDDDRLKGKRIGLNDTLDYTGLGTNPTLAADYEAGVKRLAKGQGRSKLRKASWPDFTKGKGAKVDYPILSVGGAGDWLVIPEFQRIYQTALQAGGKNIAQTWQDQYGHCVFTPEEMQATFLEYFDWIGTPGSTPGPAPTTADLEARCVSVGGVIDDTCMFDPAYSPPAIYDRIPPRADWPPAALPPTP